MGGFNYTADDDDLEDVKASVTMDGRHYQLIDGGAQSDFWFDVLANEDIGDFDTIERLEELLGEDD